MAGVEVTDITCKINAARPTGATSDPISSTSIKEDLDGYFHLDLNIFTNGEGGGVTGDNLWKIKVFLSPDHDGATITTKQDAVITAASTIGWDDTGEF